MVKPPKQARNQDGNLASAEKPITELKGQKVADVLRDMLKIKPPQKPGRDTD